LKSRIPQTLCGIFDLKLPQIAKGSLWSVCGILDLKLPQIAKGSIWRVCGILDLKLTLIAKGSLTPKTAFSYLRQL
jgi:hypothetical protein